MITIKPGMTADILPEEELLDGYANMKAVVYDVIGRRIIISQTRPPISRIRQRRNLLVTFLAKKDDELLRYGFFADFVEMLDDYEIASSSRVQALVLERKTDPLPQNLRMNFRLKPPSGSNIALFLHKEQVTIVDISLGGVTISTNTALSLKARDVVRLNLIIDHRKIELDGMVVRAWTGATAAKAGQLRYATIKYITRKKEVEAFLGRKIFHLEREMLAFGKE